MSHSIIFYLDSLNNEFYVPHSIILLNQKSIPGDMRIFASRCDKQHLSSRNWQDTECRESPICKPHQKRKSIFVLVMNWTENNVQIPHFLLGLGRTYITMNIIWILDKRIDYKICATCHKTFWNSSASVILFFQEALKFYIKMVLSYLVPHFFNKFKVSILIDMTGE